MRWLLLCLLLSACATDTSTCPPVVSYSRDDLLKAAGEMGDMDASGRYPMILRMMGDYGAERAQLRACFN